MNSSSFSSDPGVWFACLSPSQEQIMQQRIQEPMSWEDVSMNINTRTNKSRASATSSFDDDTLSNYDNRMEDFHDSSSNSNNNSNSNHMRQTTTTTKITSPTNPNLKDSDVLLEDDMLRSVDQLLGEDEDDFQLFEEMDLHSYNNRPRARSSGRRVMCKFFLNGTCKAGDQCRFSHGEEFVSSPISVPPRLHRTSSTSSVGSNHSSSGGNKYCKFYEHGYCRNAACTYIHDPSRVNYDGPMSNSLGGGGGGSNRSSMSFSPQMMYMMENSSPVYHSPVQDRSYHYPNTGSMPDSPATSPPPFMSSSYPGYGDQLSDYSSEYAQALLQQQQLQQQLQQSDAYDTEKVCPFYLKGECRYGERCRNLHIRLSTNKKKLDPASLERMAKIPCKYFRQGVCPFGNMCYFSHETVEETDDNIHSQSPIKVTYNFGQSDDLHETKATESN
jgi:hypothetical protein